MVIVHSFLFVNVYQRVMFHGGFTVGCIPQQQGFQQNGGRVGITVREFNSLRTGTSQCLTIFHSLYFQWRLIVK